MGLAIADTETRMPQPLSTMERINRNEDMRRLRELVREHSVKQLITTRPKRDAVLRLQILDAVRTRSVGARNRQPPVRPAQARVPAWQRLAPARSPPMPAAAVYGRD